MRVPHGHVGHNVYLWLLMLYIQFQTNYSHFKVHVICKCSMMMFMFNLSPSFMLPIDSLLFHFWMFQNMIFFFFCFLFF